MFCTNCGTKTPEDALFCEECGTSLKEEKVEVLSETTPKEVVQTTTIDPDIAIFDADVNRAYPFAGTLKDKSEDFSIFNISMIIAIIICLILKSVSNSTSIDLVWLVVVVAAIDILIDIGEYIATIPKVIYAYQKFKKSGENLPKNLAKKITPKAITTRALISLCILAVMIVILLSVVFSCSLRRIDYIGFIKDFERYIEYGTTISEFTEEYFKSPKWNFETNTIGDFLSDNMSDYAYVTISGKLLGKKAELEYQLLLTHEDPDDITSEYYIMISPIRAMYDEKEFGAGSAAKLETILLKAYKNNYKDLDDYLKDSGHGRLEYAIAG